MSLRLAAALCAALVAVAGCAGDPERPGTVPSKAAPSRTSSSPSASPQTIEEEVEAAVCAYFAELNRASETNDTTRLKTLSSRNCPCYRTVALSTRSPTTEGGFRASDGSCDSCTCMTLSDARRKWKSSSTQRAIGSLRHLARRSSGSRPVQTTKTGQSSRGKTDG